jgi:hypothetical protein
MNLARARCFASVLWALVLICSCSTSRDVDIARGAVEQFHQQLAAQQDDSIYDAADDHAYKQSVSRETNHGFLSRIRRKMGAFKSSTNTSYFVNASTNGTFVRLQYKTQCANGELDEGFVWRVEGGRAILVRYEANSPLLLTD